MKHPKPVKFMRHPRRYNWRKWLDPVNRLAMIPRQWAFHVRLTDKQDDFADERQFQASIISYIDKRYPTLARLTFHVPLERLRRTNGVAAIYHSLGARAGVADVVMLVPRGAYHGLTMELKIQQRRPSEAQLDFLEAARTAGYAAFWTDSYDTALHLIDAYLRLPPRAQIQELHRTCEECPDEHFRNRRRERQARKADRAYQAKVVHARDEGAATDGAASDGERGQVSEGGGVGDPAEPGSSATGS